MNNDKLYSYEMMLGIKINRVCSKEEMLSLSLLSGYKSNC